MTSKAPTFPPANSRRPTIPPRGPSSNNSIVTKEETRMDFQIEFIHADTDDRFSIDPRDITMVSEFGNKTIIHYQGKEIIVSNGYYDARERVREARLAIAEYNRTEEINREIAREHADGKFARTEVPQNSKWSF